MKKFLILIMLFFSGTAFALGRVVAYEEIQANLFGSIQSIETCGSWRLEDRLGNFRVLSVYYAGQDMLFVDIVALNESQSALSVVNGFTFSEINNDHAEVELETVQCKPLAENVVKIEASAVNGHNGEKYKISIVVDGNSKTYQYSDTITYKAPSVE